MVFIPDVFPRLRKENDEVELFHYYNNSATGQIMTTRCDSSQLTRRFFSDFLNSLNEQPA